MPTKAAEHDPTRLYRVKTEDVEYRHDGEQSWLALVYQPEGPGPFPAVLDIHGGGWNDFDRTRNAALVGKLASRGVVVVSIDYRCGAKHPYPSSLADINYATRWLKTNAARFNAVPDKVGIMGVSSGGHLALLGAMRPRDPRYCALKGMANDATLAYAISCSGVLVPFARYMHAKANKNTELMGYHDRYFPTHADQHEASPARAPVKGDDFAYPPALLIQGTADALLPHGMMTDVAARYRAAGGTIDLEWFPDMPHSIPEWPPEEVDKMIDRMRAFIAAQFAGASKL